MGLTINCSRPVPDEPRLDDETTCTVFNEGRYACNSGCDYGRPQSHRFENDVGKASRILLRAKTSMAW